MSAWFTALEARDMLQRDTGQDWPAHRLIEAGVSVAVWLEPPRDATAAVIDTVFSGCRSGFAAPVVEGGDLQRLAFTRDSGTLGYTVRPDGTPIRMEPPARFDADALRFAEADLRRLAARAAPETPAARRARLLAWHTEEVQKGGASGAVNRVTEREKIRRPTADRSNVGKDIRTAREEHAQTRRAGALLGPLGK